MTMAVCGLFYCQMILLVLKSPADIWLHAILNHNYELDIWLSAILQLQCEINVKDMSKIDQLILMFKLNFYLKF